jgi:hypothetical protein
VVLLRHAVSPIVASSTPKSRRVRIRVPLDRPFHDTETA